MFNFFLNFLFPKKCVGCKKLGTYLCSNCFSFISLNTAFVCPVCTRPSIDGFTHPVCRTKYSLDGLISCYEYKGVVKSLIYKFKYKPYLSSLKNITGKLFYEALIQNEFFYNILKEKPILIPIPLHKSKERSRGYNHAQILLERISKDIRLPIYPKILFRTKNTKPQFGLKKEERIKNIRGAFALNSNNKIDLRGKTVFLIDDIATTCTTLSECANVLKRNGAKKVLGLTFARER
ncbi:ComF family protein [Candidatus Parcubacteria bacterium]|nr:MAG: ComF family protein [Candidatus Parcubacteria bacterium]